MSIEKTDEVSKELWDRVRLICISMMQGDAKRSRAERNFSMIQSVVRDGDVFKIYALNKLTAEMLETEYGDELRRCFLLAGSDPNMKVEITFDENAKREIQKISLASTNTSSERLSESGNRNALRKDQQVFISTMPLKDYYTFEEFVEGPSNSYVLAAAKGVAKKPGQKAMNPLFIHGGTGLGKTHIMQAIGNEIKIGRAHV